MADPTDPNDPNYKNHPNYIFSGGRWQYRNTGYNEEEAQRAARSGVQKVTASTAPLVPRGQDVLKQAGLRSDERFANYNTLMPLFERGRLRSEAANPYDAAIADRARAAQMALMAQMRAQAQGPSLAAMQGQQALAQGGQQALRAAAMGQPGRASMLGMAQAGAGMGADVARARLAEQMRAQAGIGGVATGLRGADLRSAQEQLQSGLRAQDLADARARFYAQQGNLLAQSRAAQSVDLNNLAKQIDLEVAKQIFGAARTGANVTASALGF